MTKRTILYGGRQYGKSRLQVMATEAALDAGKKVIVVTKEGADLRVKRGKFVVITPLKESLK